MRHYRFYQAGNFGIGNAVSLDKTVSSHISRVLRLKVHDEIQLFNGDGFNYQARIMVSGKKVVVEIIGSSANNSESPLKIHLGQAISRGERMDYTLQKAVELGVHKITPLITERVQFRLNEKRIKQKMNHWQKVIESACEQSGRAVVPEIFSPLNLFQWVKSGSSPGLLFTPDATVRLKELKNATNLRLLIGPEGGFSNNEVKQVLEHPAFTNVSLGPRILRTETAAVSAISILQSFYGDI